MKIISVGPGHPLRGGIADFNETLTRALIKEHHNCSIYSFSLQYPGILFPGKTQYTSAAKPEDLDITTCLNSVSPTSWLSTANNIVKENPDLVIFHFWMPFFAPALGTLARKIKKKSNAKLIAICHNIVPHEAMFYDKILTKYFTNSIDGFVCLAKSVLNDLTAFPKTDKKIFTPHPLYDIFGDRVPQQDAIKHLGLQNDKKHLLFFGLVRKYKGLDLLLEAMGTDKLKKNDIKLIVAGEFYDDPEYYKTIIAKYDIADNIIIHNKFIANEEVKYYFSACDIVTQTYHTATQSGISQIAYSFDKPILTTNVGGLAEIVPHMKVGYVVEKDPNEIADSILDFFNNNRSEEFEKNAAIEKQKYTWDNFTKSLLTLHKSL